MLREDIPGSVALQRACFPEPFPAELLWTAEHLNRHLELFPEGQFVASEEGQIVGSASALIISEASWHAHLDWETTTGGHLFAAHDPNGTTLYAADISVHPDFRGRGIGRALYRARFAFVRERGLKRLGTACRIPDFRAWHAQSGGTLVEYIDAVSRGDAADRTLTPLLKYGLRALGAVPNYMEDEESAHAAALLEWTP